MSCHRERFAPCKAPSVCGLAEPEGARLLLVTSCPLRATHRACPASHPPPTPPTPPPCPKSPIPCNPAPPWQAPKPRAPHPTPRAPRVHNSRSSAPSPRSHILPHRLHPHPPFHPLSAPSPWCPGTAATCCSSPPPRTPRSTCPPAWSTACRPAEAREAGTTASPPVRGRGCRTVSYRCVRQR